MVIALDPETGREVWRFDPKVDPAGASTVTTCRGVAHYSAPGAADCPERIVTATFDSRLIALDARTGLPCTGFGQNGTVDLKQGMGEVLPGFSYVSSAPQIVRGKIVLGGWVADNQSTDEPSGVIRGFDAVTGAFAWAWDAGNPANAKGPPPGEWYTRSTPNSWAPMSADEALGLVYVPTGGSAPDHVGAHRSAASGRSRPRTTICGTMTFQRSRRCSRQALTARPFRRWPRRPNAASCSCSTGGRASRSPALRNCRCLSAAVCRKKGFRPPSHFQPGCPVSVANG